MDNKNLIFFTSEYPYGDKETFIENEFPFLLQKFNKIIIVTNNNDTQPNRIRTNNQVEIIYFPYQLSFVNKLWSIKGVFSKMFWDEINIIKKQYRLKINASILKTLLSSIQKSKNIADHIEHLIKIRNLEINKTYIYSYWLNDMAIGAAELKLRDPEIKAFSRAHGGDLYMERQMNNYLPLRSFLVNNLDACYVISDNGKQYLQLQFNVAPNKIKVSRLGTSNVNLKSELPIHSDETVFSIVSCSNIIPLKRIHLIIEALSVIKDTNIKWVHFGTGSEEVSIKRLANDTLTGSSNIQFEFKGSVGNNDLFHYYRTNKINVFINVSEAEGIPVSIMEAMSFGIPCIATNVGGNSEIVNKNNGLLLNTNPSAKEVAQAIEEFIKMNISEYTVYSNNAFNTWHNDYNSENNYPDFLNKICTEL